MVEDFLRNIFKVLEHHEIRLRDELSQVLLVNTHVLRFIAEHACSSDSRTRVVEIGSGPGNLTYVLSTFCSYVIAIELDPRFATLLRELQRRTNVDVVIGDAVMLVKALRGIDIAVGNLPYHISSQLLETLARSSVSRAIVTVQKEVGERIVARPGTDSYGKLSVVLQTVFRARILRFVSKKCFRPVPDVDSAIVELERVKNFDETIEKLQKLAKCLYSYRNKLLLKALKMCGVEASKCLPKELACEVSKLRVHQASPELLEKIVELCVQE